MAIETLTEAGFCKASDSLVEFYTDECAFCRMLNPILEKSSLAKPSLKIYRINVNEERAIADKYGIVSVPTLMRFKDGKPIMRHVGRAGIADVMTLMQDV